MEIIEEHQREVCFIVAFGRQRIGVDNNDIIGL